MPDEIDPDELEERIKALDRYIDEQQIGKIQPYVNPLAEEIRRRKRMELKRSIRFSEGRMHDNVKEAMIAEAASQTGFGEEMYYELRKEYESKGTINGKTLESLGLSEEVILSEKERLKKGSWLRKAVLVGGIAAIAYFAGTCILGRADGKNSETPSSPHAPEYIQKMSKPPATCRDANKELKDISSEISNAGYSIKGMAYFEEPAKRGDIAELYFRAGSGMALAAGKSSGNKRVEAYKLAISFLEEAVRVNGSEKYKNELAAARVGYISARNNSVPEHVLKQ